MSTSRMPKTHRKSKTLKGPSARVMEKWTISTVGELREALLSFDDDCPITAVTQSIDIHYTCTHECGGLLTVSPHQPSFDLLINEESKNAN